MISPKMYLRSSHGTLGASFKKLDATVMQTVRSPMLNGYVRFHPIGPNWRRSHTTEWKKQSAKMIAFSSDCLPHPSQIASVNEAYARSMLGRSPVGGSFVSLIEFWSTYIGRGGHDGGFT